MAATVVFLFQAKILMPLGGTEANAGYKGTGLAMLVDILTGVAAGANYATHVRQWSALKEPGNLGHLFIAVNMCCFTDTFKERLNDFCELMRCLPPLEENKPVMVPGDVERNTILKHRKQGGIIYSEKQMQAFRCLADRLGVLMMRPFKLKPVKSSC